MDRIAFAQSSSRQSIALDATLEAALEVVWLTLAVAIPLVVNLWARQPFDPAKVVLLRTLVWVMVPIWLWGRLARSGPRKSAGLPPSLWWAMGLLAAVQIMATVASVDPGLSFYGSYERSQGLLTQLTYLLLFVIVADRLHNAEQRRRLAAALMLAALVVTLTGLAQFAGWDLLGMVSDARSPLYTTLGRANFTGAYLAMLAPLVLAWRRMSQNRCTRFVAVLFAAAIFVVTLLSLARAAWLSAGAGILLFLWLEHGRRQPMRRTVWMGLFVALLVGVTTVLWFHLAAPTGSIAARTTIWATAVRLIAERPLLGYGLETFSLVFPTHFPPQLVYYQGRDVLVDRAHNLALDWAMNGGLMLVGAWLLLLTRLLRTVLHNLDYTTDPSDRRLRAAALAGLVAGLIGNLFSFETIVTATVFWLLAALAVAPVASATDPVVPNSSYRLPRRRAVLLIFVTASLLAAAIVQFNLRPQLADIAARQGDLAVLRGDESAARAYDARCIALAPWEPAYRLAAARRAPSPAAAEQVWLAAVERRPGDYQLWTGLGAIRARRGDILGSHEAFARSAEIAPTVAGIWREWGRMELMTYGAANALPHLRRAVDLDATDGEAYRLLAMAHAAVGDEEAASAAYRQVARWLR